MARTPSEQRDYLTGQYPEVWDTFFATRTAIRAAGPLDVKTQELITTAVYATVGAEGGTRAHAQRAFQAGATPAEIRQAVLLCLGVGLGFSPVYRAMDWVRQELEELGAGE